MNIDVTALQLLPEVQTPAGLARPRCDYNQGYTKVYCLKPTCVNSEVKTTIVYIG